MSFSVGTKIARYSGFSHEPQADEVLKVYKNGNFTLKSNPNQQFRPNGQYAHATGSGYSRPMCQVWDASVDQEIAAKKAKSERTRTVQALIDKLAQKRSGDGHYHLNDAQMAAAQALLAALGG